LKDLYQRKQQKSLVGSFSMEKQKMHLTCCRCWSSAAAQIQLTSVRVYLRELRSNIFVCLSPLFGFFFCKLEVLFLLSSGFLWEIELNLSENRRILEVRLRCECVPPYVGVTAIKFLHDMPLYVLESCRLSLYTQVLLWCCCISAFGTPRFEQQSSLPSSLTGLQQQSDDLHSRVSGQPQGGC
jgi:hypothetical protein